ncbi:MAG TPA: hypothetical protein VMN58_05860 [Acidimicrobiales bacterium]|nr:hypothetical protein [Acidimicrobiales bacterium]
MASTTGRWGGGPVEEPGGASLTIDCADCELQATLACDDCVVSIICGRSAHEAVIIDVAEVRAMRLLGAAGLVPRLRHARRTG